MDEAGERLRRALSASGLAGSRLVLAFALLGSVLAEQGTPAGRTPQGGAGDRPEPQVIALEALGEEVAELGDIDAQVDLRATSPARGVVSAPAEHLDLLCARTSNACPALRGGAEDGAQPDELVEYAFLPGLVTERRFAPSVQLLWRSPGGRALLQDAAASRVRVMMMPLSGVPHAWVAAYRPRDNLVVLNPTFSGVAPWMMAGTLTHELTHASDDARGIAQARTAGNCLAREQHAYREAAGFVRWLTGQLPGLERQAELERAASPEETFLAAYFFELLGASDIDALAAGHYQAVCR